MENKEEFTLEKLRAFDGIKSERILLAVNTTVYDVTSGKEFYGKGWEDRMTLYMG
jgi:membrane-associated progesterone receptor component